MPSVFQKCIAFFSEYKKFIVVGFVLFVLIVLILFPYDYMIEKYVTQINNQFPQVQVDYKSVSASVFPPSLNFKNVWIQSSTLKTPLLIEKLMMQPYYAALLAFRPSIHIKMNLDSGWIRLLLEKYQVKQGEKIGVRILSQSLPIHYLKSFSLFFKNAKGLLNLQAQLDFLPSTLKDVDGMLKFNIQPLEFQPHSFNIPQIGSLNTPLLQWTKAQGSLKINKGKVEWKPLIIGNIQDALYLDTKGFFHYKARGFIPSIQSYNLDLELQMEKELQSRFIIFDLFLSKTKSSLSPNRVKYKANISGARFSPAQIEKL